MYALLVKSQNAFHAVAAVAVAFVTAAGAFAPAPLQAVPRPSQQAAPAAAASPPTVTVEFRALLPDGRPFTDLRPEDVEFKVNGRPRTLGSLVFVEPGSEKGAAAQFRVPPPFATNTHVSTSRDTIFVIEDDSIPGNMTQPLQAAIRQFVGQLAPNDRAGFVTIPRAGLNVGLTADRAAIESAVSSLSGRAPRTEAEADGACRTQQVLFSLLNMFRGAVTPTTMVIFSGGLTPPMINQLTTMNSTTDLCFIRAEDYREVELVLLESPLSVHVVHVQDPTGSGAASSSVQAQGVEHLAGVSGNTITRLVGPSEAAMTRLAASTSASYRLTFVPEESERSGQTYSMSVKVNRPDVEVVARPSLVIPSRRASKTGAKAVAPRDMLRVGDAFRALPLRAAAYVSREGSADKARVVVMVEPMEAGGSLKAAAVGLYDEKGKLAAQATADQQSLSRMPPMIALVTKPGTYRLRAAATDAGGRAGAVDTTLDVKLSGDGPLTLSSLVLGVAEEGRFAGRLQFSDEPTAVAYLEIYGVPAGVLSAKLELADSERGPTAVTGAMRITGEPSDDQHVALGGIPIGALPPGDIIVRAIVSLDGVAVGTVSRTLRKAAR